jgi:predicted amidophosphoribosyltransferase
MSICPRCGSAVGSDAQFCSNCGAPLNVSFENFCTNPDCKRHKEHFSFAPGVRFCDQCGKLTTDGKKIEALI